MSRNEHPQYTPNVAFNVIYDPLTLFSLCHGGLLFLMQIPVLRQKGIKGLLNESWIPHFGRESQNKMH